MMVIACVTSGGHSYLVVLCENRHPIEYQGIIRMRLVSASYLYKFIFLIVFRLSR